MLPIIPGSNFMVLLFRALASTEAAVRNAWTMNGACKNRFSDGPLIDGDAIESPGFILFGRTVSQLSFVSHSYILITATICACTGP
jgi:hypothetical protein